MLYEDYQEKKAEYYVKTKPPLLAIEKLYFLTVFYLISVRGGSDNMIRFILISFLICCLKLPLNPEEINLLSSSSYKLP